MEKELAELRPLQDRVMSLEQQLLRQALEAVVPEGTARLRAPSISLPAASSMKPLTSSSSRPPNVHDKQLIKDAFEMDMQLIKDAVEKKDQLSMQKNDGSSKERS